MYRDSEGTHRDLNAVLVGHRSGDVIVTCFRRPSETGIERIHVVNVECSAGTVGVKFEERFRALSRFKFR
jgi:hypothetical protein